MADTDIEWADKVWNPVRGCTKVSPGCRSCYAETFAERFRGVKGHPYEQGFDLRLVSEKLDEPLHWKKSRRIFVNSMSDLFQDGVPDAYIDRVFAVMALAPQHTFQVLTKRAERMRSYLSDQQRPAALDVALLWAVGVANKSRKCFVQPDSPGGVEDWPLPNVWLGVSVENQHFADERIPLLLETPAAVRFLSCEPLLEGLDLAKHRIGALGLHWCIVGGESGPGARPCQVWWIRNIIGQCRDADVACFVKQLGADPRDAGAERDDMGARDVWPAWWMPIINWRRVWRPDLTSRKGDMAEWPEDLRIRRFPEVRR